MRRLLVLVVAVGMLVLAAGAADAGGDPRWRFYTADKTRYTSPWFGGAHRIMVPFGCTSAPYYVPDPRCTDGNGFHHGIDVAMRCGTRLYAARRVRVVSNDSLGPAYGTDPLLLRSSGLDLVIGHTRRVYVHEGERVPAGTLIARASDNGAPDGCHLHFERRDVGGGLDTAHGPRKLLELTPTPPPGAAPWGPELGCPPWMSVLTRC